MKLILTNIGKKLIKVILKLGSLVLILVFIQFGFYLLPLAVPLIIILAIFVVIFSIKFIIETFIGSKGATIGEVRKDIINNDIYKVADRIMYYINKNVSYENIIELINIENKEKKKTFFYPVFLVSIEKEIPTFRIPKDMKIVLENKEFIIDYRSFKYNVNQGKYIT
ncbi:MAG: hypothetical protein FWD47_08115 [Treponema sp.]|nr:hypothetical protein [Treponema sp.]